MTWLSRRFAEAGYIALRFDYGGRGESGGAGTEASLITMGEDLVAAVKWFEDETGITAPAMCGLCSGGNVVIGCLKRLPEVKILLMMSVYPFSDGDAFGRDVHRTLHFLNVYWHKLCCAETWRRFFRGDVSLKNVCGVLFGHLLHRGKNKKKEGGDTAPDGKKKLPAAVKASAVESRTQAGKEPPKKYLANLEGGRCGVFIYGTSDPDAAAALRYYGGFIKEHQLPFAVEEIPGANHNFSSVTWREAVWGILKVKLGNYILELSNRP